MPADPTLTEGVMTEVAEAFDECESAQDLVDRLQGIVDHLREGTHPLLSEPTPD